MQKYKFFSWFGCMVYIGGGASTINMVPFNGCYVNLSTLNVVPRLHTHTTVMRQKGILTKNFCCCM